MKKSSSFRWWDKLEDLGLWCVSSSPDMFNPPFLFVFQVEKPEESCHHSRRQESTKWHPGRARYTVSLSLSLNRSAVKDWIKVTSWFWTPCCKVRRLGEFHFIKHAMYGFLLPQDAMCLLKRAGRERVRVLNVLFYPERLWIIDHIMLISEECWCWILLKIFFI